MVRENWNTTDLREYLSRRHHAKEFEVLKDPDYVVPKLKVERGTLYTYKMVKQKTAYEISRSDWSSDVCSSDLG